MKNRGKPFLFMLLLVFLLAACGDPAAEVTPTPEPMPTERITPIPSPEISPILSDVTWSFDENTETLTFWGQGSLSKEKTETGDSPHYEWTSLSDVVKTIIIEDGITEIPDFSFYGFNKAISVILPSTLQFIGSYAFSHCSFEELTIPESVEQIGTGAFSNCEQLRSCDIRGKIFALEEFTFGGCTEMQSIWFQEGLVELQKDCLHGCDKINVLLIPSSVTNMEELHANGIKILIFLGDPPRMPCNPVTGKYWDGYARLKTVYYTEGNEKWREFIDRCTDEITWIEGIPEDGE